MQATDRVTQVLVAALARALETPGEHRLYRAGKLDGLFPGRTGASAEAARAALDGGLLERARLETRGKTEIEWVRITPRGVEFLHEHESPITALHDLLAVLRGNQNAVPVWLDEMRGVLRNLDERLTADAGRWLQRLASLESRVAETLRRLEAAGPLLPDEIARAHPWAIDALNYLDHRRTVSRGADATQGPSLTLPARGADATRLACPLHELFAAVKDHHPALSIAAFHDGLRQLHHRKALLLRAAEDGQMTHPEYALLDGTCVYYLAVR
jgi:hypothetical protein